MSLCCMSTTSPYNYAWMEFINLIDDTKNLCNNVSCWRLVCSLYGEVQLDDDKQDEILTFNERENAQK